MHNSQKKSSFATILNDEQMKVVFKNTKDNNVYEQYVNDPTDRAKLRAFTKKYTIQIASEAVKLHQRLVSHISAGAYNRLFGSSNNRIEIVQGVRKNEPLCLKIRVTGAWRKFFYQQIQNGFLLKQDWTGNFDSITDIFVYEINKHDYEAIH